MVYISVQKVSPTPPASQQHMACMENQLAPPGPAPCSEPGQNARPEKRKSF